MASTIPRVQLQIGSRYENIDLVQVVVKESLRQLSLDEDTSHWIGLAVREAVANAIKHGNQQDPGKKVDVEFGLEEGQVVITVQDQGRGFDVGSLPDPRSPENLLRPDGRGIFFMRKFMDDIDYSFLPGGGTVVTMRKRIGAPPTGRRQPQEEA